ncbi:MAG: phage tail protein [Rhizobiales bacterium]|nr:phage tail protein [Hyphomicrobiales bacterium]
MSQEEGRLLLIRIGNAAEPEVFANLCGLKTRSFNLSAAEVDTTIPDCNNPGGKVQKTTEPGVVSRTFSGSGAFVSGATQALLMNHVRAGEVFNAEVIVPGDGTYAGPWMVSNFELGGDMEGKMTFSGTFSAAGPLTFAQQAGAPSNTLLPAISGIAQVGVTLNALVGVWSGSAVFTYQWKAAGVPIDGATNDTYQPVVGDVGKKITVTITGTNSSGTASATSAATDEVIAA